LQKSRKPNESVLQGYSSSTAEVPSPEASMDGPRGEEPLQAPVPPLTWSKAFIEPIQRSVQDPAFVADAELDQDSAGGAHISLTCKAEMKSAISVGSGNLTQRIVPPYGPAFGDLCEFGPSLSAAINAANAVLSGERSLDMKAPTPSGTEHPELASESYNELLDKYCFVRTVHTRAV
jgi:hypothetical protein